MLDIVFIEKFEVATVIGVYDWEKTISQCLILDLQMGWNNRLAAESDDIANALDYTKVTETVERFAKDNAFELVETFAEHIAAMLMQEFNIVWIKLRVTKPGAVASARGVGVEIERGCR